MSMRENSSRTNVRLLVGNHLLSRLDAMASDTGLNRTDMLIRIIRDAVSNWENK